MTYHICLIDKFNKEWQGYHYSRTCMSKDAIWSVENSFLSAFDGIVPEGAVLRTDNGPSTHQGSSETQWKPLELDWSISWNTIPRTMEASSCSTTLSRQIISGPIRLVISRKIHRCLRKHSQITMNATSIHWLSLLGSSGGSSWLIRLSGIDSRRKKLGQTRWELKKSAQNSAGEDQFRFLVPCLHWSNDDGRSHDNEVHAQHGERCLHVTSRCG